MSEISTKPYFIRAIYEWCTDNGFTPYLAVKVNGASRVPMEFVRNGEIVLNISFGATSGLKIDNEAVVFKARFGGVSRDLYIPIANVAAIYASENAQGMAFEVDLQENLAEMPLSGKDADHAAPKSDAPTEVAQVTADENNAEKAEKKSQKPSLRLIK